MTLLIDPLIHAHKVQELAEINIIRIMKGVKLFFFFFFKIDTILNFFTNANILIPGRDNALKCSLGGRPESQLSAHEAS